MSSSTCKAACAPLQRTSGIPDYTSFKEPQQTVNIVKPRFIAFSEDDLIFVTTAIPNQQTKKFLSVLHYRGFENVYLEISSSSWELPHKEVLLKKGVSGICIGRDDIKGQSILYFANNIEGFVYKGNYDECLPYPIAWDWELKLYFREFAESTQYGYRYGRPPQSRQFLHPWALCIGPNDDKIYVVESGSNHIKVFYTDDGILSHFIDLSVLDNGKLQCPKGLAFDPSGCLHVTCFISNKVAIFSSEGQYVRHYGQSHLKGPCGIAIDPAGNSLIVNEEGNSLTIFDQSGTYIHSVGGFKCPIGIAIDPHNGSVWVADTGNNRLVNYY